MSPRCHIQKKLATTFAFICNEHVYKKHTLQASLFLHEEKAGSPSVQHIWLFPIITVIRGMKYFQQVLTLPSYCRSLVKKKNIKTMLTVISVLVCENNIYPHLKEVHYLSIYVIIVMQLIISQ